MKLGKKALTAIAALPLKKAFGGSDTSLSQRSLVLGDGTWDIWYIVGSGQVEPDEQTAPYADGSLDSDIAMTFGANRGDAATFTPAQKDFDVSFFKFGSCSDGTALNRAERDWPKGPGDPVVLSSIIPESSNQTQADWDVKVKINLDETNIAGSNFFTLPDIIKFCLRMDLLVMHRDGNSTTSAAFCLTTVSLKIDMEKNIIVSYAIDAPEDAGIFQNQTVANEYDVVADVCKINGNPVSSLPTIGQNDKFTVCFDTPQKGIRLKSLEEFTCAREGEDSSPTPVTVTNIVPLVVFYTGGAANYPTLANFDDTEQDVDGATYDGILHLQAVSDFWLPVNQDPNAYPSQTVVPDITPTKISCTGTASLEFHERQLAGNGEQALRQLQDATAPVSVKIPIAQMGAQDASVAVGPSIGLASLVVAMIAIAVNCFLN